MRVSYLALVVGVLWGTAYPITAIELRGYSAYEIALVRAILAAPTIAVLSGVSLGSILLKRKHFKEILLLSLLGMVTFSVMLNFGIEFSSSNETSFVIATYPLFTAVIARVLLREPLNKSKIIGLMIGLFGAFLIFNEGMQAASGHVFGEVAALCASLSNSLYLVLSRKLMVDTKADPSYLAFNSFIFSVPVLFVLSFPLHVSASAMKPDSILGLVWLGCVCSAIAYLLLNRALLHAPAATVTSSLMISPLVTVLATFILLAQLPTITQVTGSVLVIVGVAVAQIHSQ
jgi:drug/metabolite transporter (DMT)-like permease